MAKQSNVRQDISSTHLSFTPWRKDLGTRLSLKTLFLKSWKVYLKYRETATLGNGGIQISWDNARQPVKPSPVWVHWTISAKICVCKAYLLIGWGNVWFNRSQSRSREWLHILPDVCEFRGSPSWYRVRSKRIYELRTEIRQSRKRQDT